MMKRMLDGSFRFLLYGVIGFLLERVINLVAFGTWFDNSVLFGPVQPMYAVGMMGAVWAHQRLPKTSWGVGGRLGLVYLFTAGSEWVSGTAYFWLTGRNLWDYRNTFSFCQGPYTCFVPTAIFAGLALVFAMVVAPLLKPLEKRFPVILKTLLVGLFILDILLTYGGLYAAR